MRRSITTAALAAALGAVAACGASSTALTPLAAVTAAPDRTEAAHTSRMALSVSIAGLPQSSGGGTTVDGTGSFDYSARQGQLSLALPGGQHLDEVVHGTDVYVHSSAPLGSSTKPWVKVDLAAVGHQQGLDIGGLLQGQSTNPADQFRMLKSAATNVTKVGSETVRGASSTHYRLTVDLVKASAAQGSSAASASASLTKLLGTTMVPADVWVDSSGRIRRFRQSFDLSHVLATAAQTSGSTVPPGAEHASVTTTLELFDFGAAVNVAVPPAEEVQAADPAPDPSSPTP